MKKLGIYTCFYCDQPLSRQKKTRDHLQPVSRNGTDSPKNIVDACRQCNGLKGCLSLEEFRVVMAFRKGILGDIRFLFPGEMRRKAAAA